MSPGSDDDIKGATKKLSELETEVNTTVEMQHWAFWNIFECEKTLMQKIVLQMYTL